MSLRVQFKQSSIITLNLLLSVHKKVRKAISICDDLIERNAFRDALLKFKPWNVLRVAVLNKLKGSDRDKLEEYHQVHSYQFMSMCIVRLWVFPDWHQFWNIIFGQPARRQYLIQRVMANILEWDIVVSEFDPQSRYNNHFRSKTHGKGMNSYLPSYVSNRTTTVLLQGWFWH